MSAITIDVALNEALDEEYTSVIGPVFGGFYGDLFDSITICRVEIKVKFAYKTVVKSTLFKGCSSDSI